MKTTKEQLEEARKKAKELEEQLKQEEQEERTKRQIPFRKVAEKAHALICTYNHTDGCGWGYEEDNKDVEKTWQGWGHARYLEKVEEFLKGNNMTLEQLEALIDKLAEVKKEFPQWRRMFHHFN